MLDKRVVGRREGWARRVFFTLLRFLCPDRFENQSLLVRTYERLL